MGRTRLEAFSDGVLAVAITLLVLDLPNEVPGRDSLLDQWIGNWPAFAAYAVSFLVIGVVWLNHHAVFGGVARVDRVILVLNLLLLLFVTTIPFSAKNLASYLLTGDADARIAAAAYGLVIEGVALSFTAICAWGFRAQLLESHLDSAYARRRVRRFGVGSIVILGAVAVALVSAPFSLAIHAAIAVFYTVDRAPA